MTNSYKYVFYLTLKKWMWFATRVMWLKLMFANELVAAGNLKLALVGIHNYAIFILSLVIHAHRVNQCLTPSWSKGPTVICYEWNVSIVMGSIVLKNNWLSIFEEFEIQNVNWDTHYRTHRDDRATLVATIDFSVRPQLCWQRLVLKLNEMHPKEYYGQTSLHYR